MFLDEKIRRREMYELLSVMALGAQGDGEAIKRQLQDWYREIS
jgi:hypothetical protein